MLTLSSCQSASTKWLLLVDLIIIVLISSALHLEKHVLLVANLVNSLQDGLLLLNQQILYVVLGLLLLPLLLL